MGKYKPKLSFVESIKAATVTEASLKKRGNKRNVVAGGGWERETRDDFREMGHVHVTTCRAENKKRDSQKIDLINADEYLNGRFCFNVQCKNACEIINYDKIFRGGQKTVVLKRNKVKKKIDVQGMPTNPGVYNVILHKYTKKIMKPAVRKNAAGETETFIEEIFETVGKYAILPYDDFMSMAEKLKYMEDKLKEHGITY